MEVSINSTSQNAKGAHSSEESKAGLNILELYAAAEAEDRFDWGWACEGGGSD